MKGEFSLNKLTNSWNLENLILSSEKSELILTGTWERNDHLNFYLNLLLYTKYGSILVMFPNLYNLASS